MFATAGRPSGSLQMAPGKETLLRCGIRFLHLKLKIDTASENKGTTTLICSNSN